MRISIRSRTSIWSCCRRSGAPPSDAKTFASNSSSNSARVMRCDADAPASVFARGRYRDGYRPGAPPRLPMDDDESAVILSEAAAGSSRRTAPPRRGVQGRLNASFSQYNTAPKQQPARRAFVCKRSLYHLPTRLLQRSSLSRMMYYLSVTSEQETCSSCDSIRSVS